MGHAHHFLSRLDRLSLPHVELALSLYNDADLLRFILASSRLPEGAERVAISLADREQGPFLIITRDGRFVTCLGKGMSPGEHPIVTRGQLDALSAKAGVLHERMEGCKKLMGPKGGAGKIVRRIYDVGPYLSREEFLTISALSPIWGGMFANLFLDLGEDLAKAWGVLRPELRKTQRLKPIYDEALRLMWQGTWAASHFSQLAAMTGHAFLENSPDLREAVLKGSYSLILSQLGLAHLALRGFWCVAKIGKVYLPHFKGYYERAKIFETMFDGGCGLIGMAVRHTRLRAEIEKAMSAGLSEAKSPDEPYETRLRRALLSALRSSVKEQEAHDRHVRTFGENLLLDYSKRVSKSSVSYFERREDVPEDLAMVTALQAPLDFFESTEGLRWTLAALPAAACAPVEYFYYPKVYADAYRTPWTPNHTYALLEPRRLYHGRLLDVQAAQKREEPSRNGPCPCGSGKKYKRCCGDERAA